MTAEVFLDTSYVVALTAGSDQLHTHAITLAQRLTTENTRLVTTRGVMLEIGNALSKERYRPAAVQLLNSLEADPTVEIVPLSDDLFAEGLQLFENRRDKEWGLTDCISFVIMRQRGLTEALTHDQHFEQAGFAALLRHPLT